MYKKNNIATFMMILVIAIVVLTGCGNNVKESIACKNAAIIYGNVANSAPVSLENGIYDYVKSATTLYGRVTVIIPDTDCKIYFDEDFPEPKKDYSNSKRESIAKEKAMTVLKQLKDAQPVSEEVDLLKAMENASRALASADTAGEDNYLIIYSSGLSTAGSLSFVETKLETLNVDEKIAELRKEAELPDLTNIDVLWYYLGDVEKPQMEIPPSCETKLMELWKTLLLEECGAKSIEFKEDLPKEVPVEVDINKPYVTPIIFTTDSKDIAESDYEYKPEQVVRFDEQILKFEANTANIISDTEAFLKQAEELITYMKEHPDYKVLLVGTTAHYGSQADCIILSDKRAAAVKSLLVSAGVSVEQIVTKGVGYESELNNPGDVDGNGNFVEEIGKRNRAVYVLDYSGDKAQRLLSL